MMPELGGREATGSPAPFFGKSVNPIQTRGCRFCPAFTTCTANFFHLPASLVWRQKNYNKGLVKEFYRTESGGVACLKFMVAALLEIWNLKTWKHVRRATYHQFKSCHLSNLTLNPNCCQSNKIHKNKNKILLFSRFWVEIVLKGPINTLVRLDPWWGWWNYRHHHLEQLQLCPKSKLDLDCLLQQWNPRHKNWLQIYVYIPSYLFEAFSYP